MHRMENESIISDKEEIVEVLLEKGADVNAKDNDGNSALAVALKKGHEKLALVVLNDSHFKLDETESKYLGCMAQNGNFGKLEMQNQFSNIEFSAASQKLVEVLNSRGVLVNATWSKIFDAAMEKGELIC